ncbi:MAG: metallophosphoesterase family protein [Bradymonadia bacterium]
MKIGIISDVHANLEALEAAFLVLSDVDAYACLGDVVGYGAQPNECCDLIRRRVSVTVMGNHDAAVCGKMDYSYYRAEARQALDWHARVLTPENKRWLSSLPMTDRIEHVAFCHGSPVDPDAFEYIFSVEQMHDLLPVYDEMADVTFIGHSHLCKSFAFDRQGAREVLNTRFTAQPDFKYVVTAGSVGQPRDYDNRACCAVYDTETRTFEYRRVPYDVDAAAQKILDADLSETFGKRLFLGI